MLHVQGSLHPVKSTNARWEDTGSHGKTRERHGKKREAMGRHGKDTRRHGKTLEGKTREGTGRHGKNPNGAKMDPNGAYMAPWGESAGVYTLGLKSVRPICAGQHIIRSDICVRNYIYFFKCVSTPHVCFIYRVQGTACLLHLQGAVNPVNATHRVFVALTGFKAPRVCCI